MYHSPDKLVEESRSIGKERKSRLLTDSTKSGMRFQICLLIVIKRKKKCPIWPLRTEAEKILEWTHYMP